MKKNIFHTPVAVLIALAGLQSGFVIVEVWKVHLTDYWLPFGVMFMIGLVTLLPSGLFLYLAIFIQRKFSRGMALMSSDFFVLALFSGLLWYTFFIFLFRYVPTNNLAVIAIALLGFICGHFLLLLFHRSLRKAGYTSKVMLIAVSIIGVTVFIMTWANSVPSAKDICSRIQVGDREGAVAAHLTSYQKEPSATFYYPEDYYSYRVDTDSYLIISPGLYCNVALRDGGVVSVSVHSDSL